MIPTVSLLVFTAEKVLYMLYFISTGFSFFCFVSVKPYFKKAVFLLLYFFFSQEPPEMELLKFFRPENTTVSSRPSAEQLSNLIKTSLHYPESFNHPFRQKKGLRCIFVKIFLQYTHLYVHAHTSTHLLIAFTQILKKSRLILSLQKLPLSNLRVTMVIICCYCN